MSSVVQSLSNATSPAMSGAYKVWPIIVLSLISIAIYIACAVSLDAMPKDDSTRWDESRMASTTWITVVLVIGVIFMILSGMVFTASVSDINIVQIYTLVLIAITFPLSVTTLAINNYTSNSQDNVDEFNSITRPILFSVLLGGLILMVVASMYFVTFPSPIYSMNTSMIICMIAIILSIASMATTRISR